MNTLTSFAATIKLPLDIETKLYVCVHAYIICMFDAIRDLSIRHNHRTNF